MSVLCSGKKVNAPPSIRVMSELSHYMEYYIAINKKGLTLSQKIRRDFYKVLTSKKTKVHKREKICCFFFETKL